MKKTISLIAVIVALLFLVVGIAFAGLNPVQQNTYTTNLQAGANAAVLSVVNNTFAPTGTVYHAASADNANNSDYSSIADAANFSQALSPWHTGNNAADNQLFWDGSGWVTTNTFSAKTLVGNLDFSYLTGADTLVTNVIYTNLPAGKSAFVGHTEYRGTNIPASYSDAQAVAAIGGTNDLLRTNSPLNGAKIYGSLTNNTTGKATTAGTADTANSVLGANVSGAVAQAAHATNADIVPLSGVTGLYANQFTTNAAGTQLNGGMLTNVNASSLTGVVPSANLPTVNANIATNTPSGLPVASTYDVTNALAAYVATDIGRAIADAKATGLYTNLIDFASFTVNAPLTNSTYYGSPIGMSNCVPTAYGLQFNSNSALWFNVNVPATNTIVIVWRPSQSNPTATHNIFWQLANTNNWDGESLYFQGGLNGAGGWLSYAAAGNGTAYPAGAFTNLMCWHCQANYVASMYDWSATPRHVTVISQDGQGNCKAWDNQDVVYWFTGSATNLAFPAGTYPTTTMNKFCIGALISTNGQWPNAPPYTTHRFQGVVESVSFLNIAVTSANAPSYLQSTLWFHDWLQPYTIKRFWVTDSLIAGNSYTNNLMTMVDIVGGGGVLSYNHAVGGSKMVQYGAGYTNCLLMNQPHGKIQTEEIHVGAGINDIYGDGADGSSLWNRYTNCFWPLFFIPNVEFNVWDVNQTSTNGSLYQQTGLKLTNEMTFNSLLQSNRFFAKYVYPRSALVTQDMLNTNRVPQLSLDGLHFANTNYGDGAYRYLSGLYLQARTGWNPYSIPGDICPVQVFGPNNGVRVVVTNNPPTLQLNQ
jgi:hypothetical protein